MPEDPICTIYSLAARLGVGMGEACDRAGLSRSTPSRWKRGTKPRPNQLFLLRKAILEIGTERGIIDGLDPNGDSHGPIDRSSIVAALAAARDTVFRLELALGIRTLP